MTVHDDEDAEGGDVFNTFDTDTQGQGQEGIFPELTSPSTPNKDKQVNFSAGGRDKDMLGSMSFGHSPPGSPQSRPDSRNVTTASTAASIGSDANGTGTGGRGGGRRGSKTGAGGGNKSEAPSSGNARSYFALPPSLGSMRQYTLQSSKNFDVAGGGQGMGTMKTAVALNVFRPPFCLIQLHREKLKMRPIQGSRRMLKCYFRVCGLVGNCNDAKLAAESQMLNVSVRMKGTNGGHYTGRTTSLNWNRFSGFSTMPLQNTDHFLIYCRGSPIEFASFTPPVGADLLDAPFPSACKPTGQHFACLSVYRIAAPRPRNALYGEADIDDEVAAEADELLAKPLLLKEMSAIVEAMGTTSTRLDALRYAFNLAEQSDMNAQAEHSKQSRQQREADKSKPPRWSSVPDPSGVAMRQAQGQGRGSVLDGPQAQQRLITVPLFVWLHISEDTFRFYDHAEFSPDEISNEDKFISMMKNRLLPRQDMAIAVSEMDSAHIGMRVSNLSNTGTSKVKSVSDELKEAIASVGQVLDEGVGRMNGSEKVATKFGSTTLGKNASTAILSQEKATRVLQSTVDMRLRQLGTASLYSSSLSVNGSEDSSSGASNPRGVGAVGTGAAKAPAEDKMDSIEFKIQALKDSIAGRQKVLALNDELCKVEMKLKNENQAGKPRSVRLQLEQKSILTYDPSGELNDEEEYMAAPMNPSDLAVAQKRLVEKRLEILDALHQPQNHKFYSDAGETSAGKYGASANKYGGGNGKASAIPPLRSGDSYKSLSTSGPGSAAGSGGSRKGAKFQKSGSAVSLKKRLGTLDTVSALE
jgi:hypothetical protein